MFVLNPLMLNEVKITSFAVNLTAQDFLDSTSPAIPVSVSFTNGNLTKVSLVIDQLTNVHSVAALFEDVW